MAWWRMMCVSYSPNSVDLYSAAVSNSLLPVRSFVLAWPVVVDVCVYVSKRSLLIVQHISFSLTGSFICTCMAWWWLMCVSFSPNSVYLYSATLSLPLLPGRSSELAWPGGGWCVCTYLQTHSTYIVQLFVSLLPGRSSVLAWPVADDVCEYVSKRSLLIQCNSFSPSLTGSFICTCMAYGGWCVCMSSNAVYL